MSDLGTAYLSNNRNLVPVVRELSIDETNQTSGGMGRLFSQANIAAGSRLAGGIGLLYGSFQAGFFVGTHAYGLGSALYFGGFSGGGSYVLQNGGGR